MKSNNGKALGLIKKEQEDQEEDNVSPAVTNEERSPDSDGTVLPISPGSYMPQEVLALGLSSAGSIRARQLGFSSSDTGLEQEEGTLVTLYAPEGLDALQAIALLRRELPRESFHLNRIYRPYHTATTGDPDGKPQTDHGGSQGGGKCPGDRCYSRTAIGWKDKFADCARGINVGVIDTDVDLKHPTFADQKIIRKAFLAEGKRSSPNAHGTGILALLAGRPDSTTPGLIPEARFFVANVFFTDDNGETITDTVSLLKSLEWMNASAARLVNMSFSGPEDDLVETRLRAMRAQGFVFAAAAGNEGPAAAPTYPAAYPEVVAVTAVAKDMHIYASANRGRYIDLAAPGVDIWTAIPDAREGYRTGTSFATPFATAVLALQRPEMMSAPKDKMLDQLRTVKLGSQGRAEIYGRGLLQAPGECPDTGAALSSWTPLQHSVRQ